MIVYRITNLINNKYYIGSTVSERNRFRDHKRHLNANKHYNIHLQRAWNKYGAENFTFKPIAYFENSEDMHQYEHELLVKHAAADYTYNLQQGMQAPRHAEETKKKIGDAARDVPKPERTAEHKKNLSEALKGNTIWLGKTHTDESKLKMSKPVIAISPSGTETRFDGIDKCRQYLGMTGLSNLINACKTGKPLSTGMHVGWGFYYEGQDNRQLVPDEYKDYPRTRSEAKTQGSKYYFTGNPCSRGHITLRLTKGECKACRKEDWERAKTGEGSEHKKAIIELSTDTTYESLKTVKEIYNISPGLLSKHLKADKPFAKGRNKGLHFQYV